MNKINDKSASYTAECVMRLRMCDDVPTLQECLTEVTQSLVSSCAQIAIELENISDDGKLGHAFVDQIETNFAPAVRETMVFLRDVRGRYVDGGETVN